MASLMDHSYSTATAEIRCVSQYETVRMDFVLGNIFAHFLKRIYKVDALPAANTHETLVLRDWIRVLEQFKDAPFKEIHEFHPESELFETVKLEVFLHATLKRVVRSFEGITWRKVAAFFAFMGHFVVFHLPQLPSDSARASFVDAVFHCFCGLVKKELYAWIMDHSGWRGIVAYVREATHPDNSRHQRALHSLMSTK